MGMDYCTMTLCRRVGLTLAELVVSLTATTVLVGGMASAIVLATRAMPESSGDLDKLVSASAVAEQISSELACARAIVSRTANAIEFRVADQDGDGQPETIRYEWSGSAGTPLLRQFNGEDKTAVLNGVTVFALMYDETTGSRPSPPGVFQQVIKVHLTLQAGTDPAGRIETSIQLLNQPEVGG